MAANARPYFSIPCGQGASCHRPGFIQDTGPSGAGAYLHADDCIDEEQHGYEEGDIRERLEERKHSSQCWPLTPVTAWAQPEDPHEATCFLSHVILKERQQ